MAHALYHSRASAHRYGGRTQDYLPLHSFMDQTKALVADCRHRMILHNEWGVEIALACFGSHVASIPTRQLVEDHIREDLGYVPTLEQTITALPPGWRTPEQSLEQELDPGTAWRHAERSARRFGGEAADYHTLHALLDSPAQHLADWRHRLPTHNAWGPFLCEAVLGAVIVCADGREVPTRSVAEDHIAGDLRHIPSMADALSGVAVRAWMCRQAEQLSARFPQDSVAAVELS